MSSRTDVAFAQRRAVVARIGVYVVPMLAAALFGFYLNALGVFQAAPDSGPVANVATPSQISGENATLSGSGTDAQRFEMTAQSGVQDKDEETLVHLKTVSGMFQRPAGNTLAVNATRARFDGQSLMLELDGDVVFDETGRFRATMDGAQVDTQSQTLVSKSPVTVSVIGGTITANKFTVTGQGQRMLFEGGVKASFVGEGEP